MHLISWEQKLSKIWRWILDGFLDTLSFSTTKNIPLLVPLNSTAFPNSRIKHKKLFLSSSGDSLVFKFEWNGGLLFFTSTKTCLFFSLMHLLNDLHYLYSAHTFSLELLIVLSLIIKTLKRWLHLQLCAWLIALND